MLPNREKEILRQIFRLIEEQNRALESRLCDKVAVQCEERSDRIRNLLEQIREDKHSNRADAVVGESRHENDHASPNTSP